MKTVLSLKQIDALREIVSIGAGNAATALSQMTKKRTNISVPNVHFLPISEASTVFGLPEAMVTAVYLQLLGDLTGVILFTYSKETAVKFSDLLLGKRTGKKILTEIGQSSLKEASTILTGAYLNAMSKMLKKRLLISSPAIASDMSGAIIENVLLETNKDADFALIIETEFMIVNEKIDAFFFFIPDKSSLDELFRTMGV